MRGARHLAPPVALAPVERLGQGAEPTRARGRVRRRAGGAPFADRLEVRDERQREGQHGEHGEKGQLERGVEEARGSPDEQRERGPARRVERARAPAERGRERRQREGERRAHDRGFGADAERVGPDARHRRGPARRGSAREPPRRGPDEPADECDVEAADDERVDGAAFAEALGRFARETEAVAEHGGLEDAGRVVREDGVGFSDERRAPRVEQRERQKHGLVVEAFDEERALESPARVHVAHVEVFAEGRYAGVAVSLRPRECGRHAHARAAPQLKRVVGGRRARVAHRGEQLDASAARRRGGRVAHGLDAHREQQAVGRNLGRAFEDAGQLDGVAGGDSSVRVESAQPRRAGRLLRPDGRQRGARAGEGQHDEPRRGHLPFLDEGDERCRRCERGERDADGRRCGGESREQDARRERRGKDDERVLAEVRRGTAPVHRLRRLRRRSFGGSSSTI